MYVYWQNINKMNSRLAYLATLSAIILLSPSWGWPFAYAEEIHNYDYYFKKYSVEVVYSPSVDTAFPSRAKPDEQQDNTDLNYWVQDVLPFVQDKTADRYLVMPLAGIVLPILTPSPDDQTKIAQGETFDHYHYLEQWGLFYYGSAPSTSVGNMVIAAHSSYAKSKAWRYKTIFQGLPISRAGDKVFYYEKNNAWSYDFYEYTITDSFETDKYNTAILKQDVTTPTLTTYGCYKIGTNDARWVNVATLTSTKKAFVTLTPPQEHAAAPLPVAVPKTPALTTQSAPSTTTPPPPTTPPTAQATIATLNPALLAYMREKQHPAAADTGSTNTGTSTVTPPTEKQGPVIEEMPVTLRILYGPILNRLVYHLIQEVRFNEKGIHALIDKFTHYYEATKHPTKRQLQGYIIQKLMSFLE